MKSRRPLRPLLVHLVRAGIVTALLLLIPSPREKAAIEGATEQPVSIDRVRDVLPNASAVAAKVGLEGFGDVLDSQGKSIGRVARTLPEAADVIGYRGPSESMVLFDDELNVLGVRLIDSADTQEHVDAVLADEAFFQQFQVWSWGGPPDGQRIDGVSGATLTSLALAKGVLKRIGGDRPSLVFPDPVLPEEVARWFPGATSLRVDGELVEAIDDSGQVLGHAIRTGPLADSIIGYQGPSELLIRLERSADKKFPAESGERERVGEGETTVPNDETVSDIQIRRSFDNEPYVGYCRTEYSFWSLFKGRHIDELASMDLAAERVEGVSGATMSSMAIAETLVAAAQEYQQRCELRRLAVESPPTFWSRLKRSLSGLKDVRFAGSDAACLMLLLAIPWMRRAGWFRKRYWRRAWLVGVVLVIGFWSGNLISLALMAGWSAEGIAWRIAPALAAIAVVAFVSPVAGKSNPYCSHLCPHGAIQQLIRPSSHSRRHWKMPSRWAGALKWLPGLMLVTAYVLLVRVPTTDLSSWEPFHAYLYRIAPWTSLALAAGTLVFSSFVPMGYCRLGCPTGRLLDHLRRSATSDRLKLSDGVAVALLVFALLSAGGVL